MSAAAECMSSTAGVGDPAAHLLTSIWTLLAALLYVMHVPYIGSDALMTVMWMSAARMQRVTPCFSALWQVSQGRFSIIGDTSRAKWSANPQQAFPATLPPVEDLNELQSRTCALSTSALPLAQQATNDGQQLALIEHCRRSWHCRRVSAKRWTRQHHIFRRLRAAGACGFKP